MKIKYAIVSCDQTQMYKEFWPIVKKLWNRINITPILVEICEVDDIKNYGDHIHHKIKKIDNVDAGFQSQISRMFITKYYDEDVCITSDIDMLPLSKTYFNDDLLLYDDDSLIIFTSDAYKNVDRYPICYNAGKGKKFNQILDLDCSFHEYCHRLLEMNLGWDTDEIYFGKCINSQNNNGLIFLNRTWDTNGIANRRIDRYIWKYDLNLLKQNHYIDSHSLRPYSMYKEEIDKIINIICQ